MKTNKSESIIKRIVTTNQDGSKVVESNTGHFMLSMPDGSGSEVLLGVKKVAAVLKFEAAAKAFVANYGKPKSEAKAESAEALAEENARMKALIAKLTAGAGIPEPVVTPTVMPEPRRVMTTGTIPMA